MGNNTIILVQKNPLKTAYNNGLGRLPNFPKYNSASEMFVNLNILSFGEQLRKSVFSFRTRIINSDNSLVYGIVTSASPLFSKIMAWCSDVFNTY